MHPFTLKQLHYLVSVAEAGGITAAARELAIAQPSISAAIKQLERTFELQLFVRQPARGIALTPAGRQLVAEAKRLLEHASEFAAGAGDSAAGRRGVLELGCFTTLGPVFLPPLLNTFHALEPEIEVRFQEATIDSLQERLFAGLCELALLYDIELDARLEREELAHLTSYVLLVADHPLAKQKAIALEALADLPMVLLDQPLSREYFLSIFLAAGLEPKIRHRTENVETIRGLVAQGEAFSLLTLPAYADQSIGGKALVRRPLRSAIPPLRIVLAWPNGARLTARAEAFARHCRSYFAKLPEGTAAIKAR